MKKRVKLVETMWAEMRPDVYGGSNANEHVPAWHAYGEGDKEASDGDAEVTLAARCFPPGTRIIVSEPLCPKCESPRIPKTADPILYAGPCSCGFDWDAWVEKEFG